MTNSQAAIKVVRTLRSKGFEALFAGGCVRDMLLGKRPKDYDVATSAVPQEICSVFRRTIKIGAKFGVIVVLLGGKQIEVATFRTDEGYADGRRPDKVSFTSAKKDALRRDFTINGMFYDPLEKQVIDYVNGQKDLDKKLIRTIGSADRRFSEDYLRMLRAVRFTCRNNFKMTGAVLKSIQKNAAKIANVSGERIACELESIAKNGNCKRAFELLVLSRLAGNIFEYFKGRKTGDCDSQIFDYLPAKISFPLFVAAMFSRCSVKQAVKDIKKLKLSRRLEGRIKFLLEKRNYLLGDLDLAHLKLIKKQDGFEDLYKFQRAICRTQKISAGKLLSNRCKINKLDDKPLPPVLLDGRKLLALGVKPGKMVGVVLEKLYLAQLNEQISTQQQAVKWVKTLLGSMQSAVDSDKRSNLQHK